MGSYLSRCLSPPASDQKAVPSEPSPENGARPNDAGVPSTSAPVKSHEQVVETAPVAASPDVAVPSVSAPRVDTGMSIPISISESDDGTAKGDVGPGYVNPGSKEAKGGKPPPGKPVKGGEKRRFGLPFGRTDEE